MDPGLIQSPLLDVEPVDVGPVAGCGANVRLKRMIGALRVSMYQVSSKTRVAGNRL